MFLFEDEKVIEVRPTKLQSSEFTSGPGGGMNVFHFDYYVTKDQISQLMHNRITSVRIYFSDAYRDYDVNEKNRERARKLTQIFSDELQKHL